MPHFNLKIRVFIASKLAQMYFFDAEIVCELIAYKSFHQPVYNPTLPVKRSARGYRNPMNLIIMIYLRLGRLKFNLPT